MCLQEFGLALLWKSPPLVYIFSSHCPICWIACSYLLCTADLSGSRHQYVVYYLLEVLCVPFDSWTTSRSLLLTSWYIGHINTLYLRSCSAIRTDMCAFVDCDPIQSSSAFEVHDLCVTPCHFARTVGASFTGWLSRKSSKLTYSFHLLFLVGNILWPKLEKTRSWWGMGLSPVTVKRSLGVHRLSLAIPLRILFIY